MIRGVWIRQKIWDKLQEIKVRNKVPISGQLVLALEAYWKMRNRKYGKQKAYMGQKA